MKWEKKFTGEERMFAREKKGEECLLRDRARGKERENEGSKEKECV